MASIKIVFTKIVFALGCAWSAFLYSIHLLLPISLLKIIRHVAYMYVQNILSVTSHFNPIAASYLINIFYLTKCAFIRSWWSYTFWMKSLMMLNQNKNYIIIASLKSVPISKLINRIPGLCLLYSLIILTYYFCVFWCQVYQARLWERMLYRSTSLTMSTSVLKALPGKLDIKRHSPSILYLDSAHQGWV